MPIHLRAKENDYAKTVLVVGDPGRAERIGEMLTGTRLVTDNRGLLGFTGKYKEKDISVQTTGIGCPSAAIVIEELLQMGVKRVIRIGTCGGIAASIKPLDIVAAVAASPFDGTTRSYLNAEPHAPYASFDILKQADRVSARMGIPIRFGGIASVDVFYSPDPDYVPRLRAKGILAVEMETSLIYYLANRSGIEAASFLMVSDIVGGGEEFTKYVTDEELQSSMDKLITLVLELCGELPGV
jgi:DeoD family purine-nucleoside phosphorylase